MTEYSKYNIVYRLQKWMDSVIGQTFLNYAYSWGASVVILGTLFKLTHLPGANLMLYLGMGTEVLVFFLSAFDRPFDKTTIGLDLTTGTDAAKETEIDENMSSQGNVSSESSGKVIITGNVQPIAQGMPMQQSIAVVGGSAAVGGSVSAESTQEMEEATNNYVEELKRLTTMLSAVADQSQRLTRDSEEMENLNTTLTGISRVYEMQLKSASAQMGTIDEINEQSKRMAEQIAELNKIYARMIEAVKVRA